VVGIDCCDVFLEIARKEAEAQGLKNVRFMRGDAEIALPANAFDFVFARFGTMFFANPVTGLRNMRLALKPGGRMVHIVWRNRADNPWLSMAKNVVLRFLPPPGDDALTCGPGPFSMADEATVRTMMKAAGYDEIEFRRVDAPVLVGSDVADAIAFQLAIGPAGEVFREAGAQAEEKRDQIEAALAEAISHEKISADGIVMVSTTAVQLLSGMLVPLPLFPAWSQDVLRWLPFAGLVDLPFRIYTGHIAIGGLVLVLARQLGWTLVFVALGRGLLGRGLRRVVVQGG
jgi:hypothetical protein